MGQPREQHEWIFDYLEGQTGEKDLHDWAQGESEARYLIDAFSEPGNLILDPMTGSGTTLQAASDLGRKAEGWEINPETYELAKRHLQV